MNEAAQVLQIPANASARRTTFWLILRRRHGGTEVLTRELSDGRRVLPVFSFEEEAVVYARTATGSRARPTSLGELLSILYGPCRGVDLVALDPWPNTEAEALTGLVSLGRNRFLNLLMNRDRPARTLPGVSPVSSAAYGTGRSYPPLRHPGRRSDGVTPPGAERIPTRPLPKANAVPDKRPRVESAPGAASRTEAPRVRLGLAAR